MPDQKPMLDYAKPRQNVGPAREFMIGMFIGLVIVATTFVTMLMAKMWF